MAVCSLFANAGYFPGSSPPYCCAIANVPKPYSYDLRQKAIEAIELDALKISEASLLFNNYSQHHQFKVFEPSQNWERNSRYQKIKFKPRPSRTAFSLNTIH